MNKYNVIVVFLAAMAGSFWGGYVYHSHEISKNPPPVSTVMDDVYSQSWEIINSSTIETNIAMFLPYVQQGMDNAAIANKTQKPDAAIKILNAAIKQHTELFVRTLGNKIVDKRNAAFYEREAALYKELAKSFELKHDTVRQQKAMEKSRQAEQLAEQLNEAKNKEEINQVDKLLM